MEDISNSRQSNFSQEDDSINSISQDSGYAVAAVQSNVAPPYLPSRPASFQAPFPPPGRNVSNLSSLSNTNQFQQVENRWKFGSNNSWTGGVKTGTNPLERDLQQHLTEMLGQVNRVPGKISTIVEEFTKFLQNLSSYSKVDICKEIDSISEVLGKLKDEVGNNIARREEFKKKVESLESLVKECFLAAEIVTNKKNTLEAKLESVTDKVAIADDLNGEIEEGVATLKEKLKKISTHNFANSIVTKELNMYNVKPEKTPLSRVPTKPLPSIRRLPTLSVMNSSTVTANKSKIQHYKGDGGARQLEDREVERDDSNFRKVKSSVRAVRRERNALNVEIMECEA